MRGGDSDADLLDTPTEVSLPTSTSVVVSIPTVPAPTAVPTATALPTATKQPSPTATNVPTATAVPTPIPTATPTVGSPTATPIGYSAFTGNDNAATAVFDSPPHHHGCLNGKHKG